MYVITNTLSDHISTAKPKQRYEDNFAAIKLLKSLLLSGDKPTRKQLDILAKFNGWGSCHTVFNTDPDGWQKQAQQDLKHLLGDKEYNSASESILNAHYTEPTIIKAMWDKIAGLGFSGGKILEPSCGTGFFLGSCPGNIQSKSEFHAVELEKTSADIARFLYPEAKIYNQGFETVSLPDNYFDLVTGNVPFGNYKCPDPRYDWLGLSIHNYFFAKCSDLVRPGGLICLLTSPYTLDAPGSQEFRRWLGETQRLKLVSAIRLPAGVFKGVANTMVSPDILIFQKMPGKYSDELNYKEWEETIKVDFYGSHWSDTDNDYSQFNINKYFYNEYTTRQSDKGNRELVEKYRTRPESIHWYQDRIYSLPHKLLGTPGVNQLYGQGFALNDDGRDVIAGIAAIEIDCEYQPNLVKSDVLLIPPELQDTKDQSFVIWENKVYQRDGKELKLSKIDAVKLIAVHQLRDKLQQVIKAQSQLDDDRLAELQSDLLATYNRFVRDFGKINSKQNLSELSCDPNYYLLRTLEKPNDKLADIFYKRVARQQRSVIGKVENIEDAIIHSLNNKGNFDLSYVCQIMELDSNSVTQQLADKKLGFYNPGNEQWELKDKYLSGNVYLKLKQAEKASLLDNVAALKAVQPTPMLPDTSEEIKLKCLEHLGIDWTTLSEDEKKKLLFKTIKVQLGTSWISSLYYKQFAEQVLNISVTNIKYLKPPVASWVVSHYSQDKTEYGTKHLNSGDLFTMGLNGIDPRIKFKDLDGKEHTDVEATEEARGKLEQIKKAFKQWIWQESDRCLELCNYYNTNINVYADRQYDGSWLQLPGSNPDIKLNYWQLNGIARGLESNSTFYAWDVGTGKAQPLDAKVLTPNGWKPMGDIQVNDLVIAGDGTPTKVLAVYPQGEKEIYTVTFSDGSSTECCKEHLWLTQTYQERMYEHKGNAKGRVWEGGKPKIRSLEEIQQTLVAPHLKAKNHSIPVVKPVHFNYQELPLAPYLFGVILGDGCLRANNRVFVTSEDIEIIDNCKDLLPEGIKIVNYGNNFFFNMTGKKERYERNPIGLIFEKLGLLGFKSEHKFIPDIYKFNTFEVRLETLRGLMDTDGSVCNRGTSVEFYSSSLQLAKDVQFLVQSLGGIGRLKTKKKTQYTHKGEKRFGLTTYKVSIALPPEINPFRLRRKANCVVPKSKYLPIRYITSVDFVGVKQAQCISVEHPSHLYVTDDFIVTHNTFTLIATAMESKRLGLINKPIICCLNGTEKQIYEDWIKLYPMANVLMPDKLDAEGRKLFTASLLTGDFDGAIITHSQFFMMKMGDQYVINFLENEKALLEDFLKDEGNNTHNESSKALKKAIKSVESRIAKIKNSGRKDDHINFEGICDFLAIDEIQMAKNLRVTTKMVNVRGINSNESQRALDTYMKLLYVSGNLENLTKAALSEQDNKVLNCIKEIGCSGTYEEIEAKVSEVIGGRVAPEALKANLTRLIGRQALFLVGDTYKIVEVSIAKGKIIGATGTILSNTMAEIFTWQRMFQLATLQDLNLEHFDSWASQFGEVISGAEITPSQQYKVINRFKSFSNLSALHGLLSQFCDIVTFENVCGDLARPDGKFIDIVTPPSEAQLSFLREALKRSEAISQRLVEPYEDNMLKVTTDLLKAALSMRLMGEAKESPESKIHECIWNVFKIYEATNSVKGVQLIFCDYSVPKNDRYHVYGYVKQMLILLGIPENQIEFIHDHDKAKRKKLFEQVNAGKVRILLGSTEKLGTGCNVHKQGLWAIHHLDAPWTPKGMIQREGRIIRQGNGENLGQILKTGYVFRYITERLDALRWQTLQWKEEMIRKFLNGAVGLNEITDTDEASYSYSQVKSLATGNPLLIEEANLRSELNSLLIQQRSHQQTHFGLSGNIKQREKLIAKYTDDIFWIQEDIKNSQGVLSEASFTKLNKQWKEKIYAVIDNPYNGESEVGTYRGLTLYVRAEALDLENDVKLSARLLSKTGKSYNLPVNIPGTKEIKFRRTLPLESINDLLSELPNLLKTYQKKLTTEKQELTRFQSLIGKKFEYDGRILEIQHRLVEIAESMSQTAMAVDVGTESKGDTSDEECAQVETEDLSTTDTSIDASFVEQLKQRQDNPQWLQQIRLEVDNYTVKTVDVSSQENMETSEPMDINEINLKVEEVTSKLKNLLDSIKDPKIREAVQRSVLSIM